MIWYVAIVAILNLGLGYALANMLNGAGLRTVFVSSDTPDSSESADY